MQLPKKPSSDIGLTGRKTWTPGRLPYLWVLIYGYDGFQSLGGQKLKPGEGTENEKESLPLAVKMEYLIG